MNETPTQGSAVAGGSGIAPGLRVAIVHHWFVRRGGGERVVEALAELLPQADLFTLVMDPAALGGALVGRRLRTSFLQFLPGTRRHHRLFLPLFPLALEQFDLRGYDLVLSSESGPSKGVVTGAGTCHLCYCHSPMRYLWDMYHDYRERMPLGALGRALFAYGAHRVRIWDHASADRVDFFAASSRNAARRIEKHYRRGAEVIYPPVDVSRFSLGGEREDFYLIVSRLVRYKRVDLAIAACAALGRRLVVIGDGEEARALAASAGSRVEFLRAASDGVVRRHLAACRALLFPGEEDFGLTPLEAQASGRPVVAFAQGGALETVRGIFPGEAFVPGATGVFFCEQTAAALADAILRFERFETQFSAEAARSQAERFAPGVFRARMAEFVQSSLARFAPKER